MPYYGLGMLSVGTMNYYAKPELPELIIFVQIFKVLKRINVVFTMAEL